MRETIPIPEGDVAVGFGVGGQYLVVTMDGASGPSWMCARVSDRAVECVRRGQVSPWTVLRHSCTGTVDIYETRADGSLQESVVLCSTVDEHPAHVAA